MLFDIQQPVRSLTCIAIELAQPDLAGAGQQKVARRACAYGHVLPPPRAARRAAPADHPLAAAAVEEAVEAALPRQLLAAQRREAGGWCRSGTTGWGTAGPADVCLV